MSKESKILFFVSALLISLAIGYGNKAFIKVSNPENQIKNNFSLVHGGTIYSIDNAWYLPQVRNLLEGNGYRIDASNDYTTVRRTPGYSLWAFVHYALFGEKTAHHILPISQSILYALSALALVLAVFNISGRKRLASLTGVLYILCPFIVGYTFFTITEAIHPEVCVFAFYFYSVFCKTKKIKFLFATGILIGIATLIRPTNGILLISVLMGALSIYSPFRSVEPMIKSSFALCLGFALILTPWIIRNYIVTKGEIVVLEKFYNDSPMNFGRGQLHMSQWMMGWSNPEPVHYCNRLIQMAQNNEISSTGINELVEELPPHAFFGNSKEQVRDAFVNMKDCFSFKLNTNGLSPAHPDYEESICELEVAEDFASLNHNFKKAAPFHYYFWTPFFVRGKEYIFQSFSTMHPFTLSADWNPTLSKNALKAYCYLFNLALFMGLIASLFYYETYKIWIVPLSFSLLTFLIMLYLVHFEGRYIMSIYPFLIIFTSLSVEKIHARIARTIGFAS